MEEGEAGAPRHTVDRTQRVVQSFPCDVGAGAGRGTLVVVKRRTVIVLAACGVLVGCGDDGVSSDAGEFCATGRENQELITNPPLTNDAEIAASLDFYRLMGDLAPLEISEEWNDLVLAMETANEVEPGNAASEQLAAQTAYASERSAYEVMVWFRDRCNVQFPITTIVPHDGSPMPPVTTPPPTTQPSE